MSVTSSSSTTAAAALTATPTSLRDIFIAPEITDVFGNQLYSNWSVTFPPYRFNVTPRAEAVRFSSYQAQAAWPNLYNFTGNIIDNVEPTDKAKSFLRKIIIGATKNDPGMGADLINIVLEFKSLLAIVIIGLLVSFILVPVVSFITYCCVKKRYRDHFFRYNLYSSDSLATAAYDQRPSSRPSNSTKQQQPQKWPSATHSHGGLIVVMALVAMFMAMFAAFGLGASFYFNDSFSFSILRTASILEEATNDITAIANTFVDDFNVVGKVISDDVQAKMDFINKATSSLGNMFGDQLRVVDLLQKSQALLLLFMLLSWEKSTMGPLAESLSTSANLTQRINKIETNLTAFRNDEQIMGGIDGLCSISYNTSSTSCNRHWQGQTSNLCSTCLLPSIPASIDPALLSHFRDRNDVQQTMDILLNQTRSLMSTKLGQMVTRDDLMRQFTGIKDVFSADFATWTSHYKHWYNTRVTAVTDGSCNNLLADDATTLLPSSTSTTAVTTTTTTKQSISTTTTFPTSETANDALSVTINQVLNAFNGRHYVTVTLLIVAAIQLTLMIGGSACLLVVFCGGVEPSHSFRTRQASLLEKIGCACVFAGAIIFVAFTGPLLCLLAAGHFFAGGFIDKSVCKAIRSDDHGLLDAMLNVDEQGNEENILRYVLPPCATSLIDSVDEELLNERLTIGKFLTAAKSGETLNQYLQLNDTVFVRDVKNLTYLSLTSAFVVYNAKIEAYMNNLTKLLTSGAVYHRLAKEVNVNQSATLGATVKGCTSCVINSILIGTGMKRQSNNTNFDQQMDWAMRYKTFLTQYTAALPPAQQAWADSAYMIASTTEQKELIVKTMHFVENYFQVILNLLKDEIAYMISMLVDNISNGITLDVGRLQAVYSLYNGLVREYACVELIGSMNAFWFFVGVYLIFSAISAILLIATYAALTSISISRGTGSDYWQSRHCVSHTLPTIIPGNKSSDSFAKMYQVNKFPTASSALVFGGSYGNKGFISDNNNNNNNVINCDSAESYIMGSVISEAAAQEIIQETNSMATSGAISSDFNVVQTIDESELDIDTKLERSDDDIIDDDDQATMNTVYIMRK